MTRAKPQDVIKNPAEGNAFRVRRDIYTDENLFELEMKHLFEGGWIFLAHTSQLQNKNDYFTTTMGRKPVVLMRDAQGEIRAFHNACPHRGAMICNLDQGNAGLHVCPFHSWSFGSNGKLRAIKARSDAAYSQTFLDSDQNLKPIARLEEYRGFLFGSLEADVPALADYLGDAKTMIDLVVDQSVDGLELVPGRAVFTYEGNWKHQLENCSDAYHVTSVHSSFLKLVMKRTQAASPSEVAALANRASFYGETPTDAVGGTFQFKNGHTCFWAAAQPYPGHPLWDNWDVLVANFGEVRAKWMVYQRNLTLFPNVQIADNASTQLRILRPLSANRTEMITYCLAPKGEAPEARYRRLRQYEDFFQPTGMATPDDLVIYEDCQLTAAGSDWWHEYARGLSLLTTDLSPEAVELGIKPVCSVRGGGLVSDETLFQSHYRSWLQRLGPSSQQRVAGEAQ